MLLQNISTVLSQTNITNKWLQLKTQTFIQPLIIKIKKIFRNQKNAKAKQLLVPQLQLPHMYSPIDSKYQESIQETTNAVVFDFAQRSSEYFQLSCKLDMGWPMKAINHLKLTCFLDFFVSLPSPSIYVIIGDQERSRSTPNQLWHPQTRALK